MKKQLGGLVHHCPAESFCSVLLVHLLFHAHAVSTQQHLLKTCSVPSPALGCGDTKGRIGSLPLTTSEPQKETHERKQLQNVLISDRMKGIPRDAKKRITQSSREIQKGSQRK